MALNLGNSMLLFARNLPTGMAISLCIGKLLVFSVKSLKQREFSAVPSGFWMFLRGLPRALRERRAIGPEAVRAYRSLNPNSRLSLSAFLRRTNEVLSEGENKPVDGNRTVGAAAMSSGSSTGSLGGDDKHRKAS
jgi:hypothetical protein